ncbi:MAG: glycosyltransferase [Anaerolineaceae bacterium]
MECKSITFFSNHTHESALEHLRIHAPLRQAGITVLRGVEGGQFSRANIDTSDLFLYQRDFPEDLQAYQVIRDCAKADNKRLIFDLDDLLFLLPEDHPDRQSGVFAPALLPILQALMEADLVTVTTNTLKNALAEYTSRVAVLPNYFDDEVWSLRAPALKTVRDAPIVIGYMGGDTHKPDLAGITPVLLDLLNRYPDQIEFKFLGVRPPEDIATYRQVKWVPSKTYEYEGFARDFQTQQADIFIAPLADNLFNRCKSGLKFFEYSALGVPGVFSDLDPYNQIITHGQEGLLAGSLDAWEENLIKLIEDEDLRYSLAVNAQAAIRKNWLLSKNAYRWADTYRDFVCGKLEQQPSEKTLPIELTRSLSTQFSEYNQKQKDLASDLNAQIAALTAELTQKESEFHDSQAVLDSVKAELKAIKAETEEVTGTRTWKFLSGIKRFRRSLVEPGNFRHFLSKVKGRFNNLDIGNSNIELKKKADWIRNSDLFDEAWYLEQYPDAADESDDPIVHYLSVGADKGYDPSPFFSTALYLEMYPDVKNAGINPLFHYVKYGIREGRQTRTVSAGYRHRATQSKASSSSEAPSSSANTSLKGSLKRFYHKLPIPNSTRQKISGARRRIAPRIGAIFQRDAQLKLEYDNFRLPWRRTSLKKCLTFISEQIPPGGKITHLISLPFLSTGGAELVAMNYARAITSEGTDCVLLLTDNPLREVTLENSPKVIVLSIADNLPGQDLNGKKLLVRDLIVALRPRVIHNINSDIMWTLFVEDGNRLKDFSRLFASIFAMQFDERGSRIGYAEYYLKDSIANLSGLLTDNKRFISDAVTTYDLQNQAQTFIPIYTPSRAISERSLSIARSKLQEYASRVNSTDRLSCVWAGRMDKEKRWDLFLEVVERCQFADFAMFGQSVVDSASALPDLSNLEYKGKFNATEELFLEHSYDVFMFTSKWEGLPNILIEAGTWGVPIIAPNVGGVGELINAETGFLLPEKPTSQDYLEAMRKIKDNPQEAARRAENLLELILMRHTWDHFLGDVKNVPGYLSGSGQQWA